MEERAVKTSAAVWLIVAALILATTVGVIALVRFAPIQPPGHTDHPERVEVMARDAARADHPGIQARLSGADAERLSTTIPAMAFALAEHEVLHPRQAGGSFEGIFAVRFDPGPVRRGHVGAVIQGGVLIVLRRGNIILAAEAGGEPILALSGAIFMPGGHFDLEYRFQRHPTGPTRLQAVWQPDGIGVPAPLPSDGAGLFASTETVGRSLVRQFRCVVCHESGDPALQIDLSVPPAPQLAAIGARVRPAWIEAWIRDPRTLKPDALMPRLFGDEAGIDRNIDDLVHYLASLGGPMTHLENTTSVDLVATGRVMYDRVGCFACHGPYDGSGPATSFVALGPLAQKTTTHHLAAFLRDPLELRPDGRMPSMLLDELESEAIAAALIERDRKLDSVVGQETFTADPASASRGARLFAETGCAACHHLGDDRATIVSTLAAPGLESIAAAVATAAPPEGCLAERPGPRLADFALATHERRAIIAYLRSLETRRTHDVPIERLAGEIDRLRCLACHSFGGTGGPDETVSGFFVTEGDFDVGDEGRLPPDLQTVGVRLNEHYFDEVLLAGARARPHIATRMPQYGEAAVAGMYGGFVAVSGAARGSATNEPLFTTEAAQAGRTLAGSNGFNCIQCHSIAGNASTETPGPDLALMTERLQYDYFASWIHEPKLWRRVTRMPSFFLGGHSGFVEHYEGDALRQIEALWSYLSQGEHLPLPEGLANPGQFLLEVGDEPIVFRTFMKDVGPRAVAIGFPEGVHAAYDAATCRLRTLWTGRFLDASGVWAARGGSETNPVQGPSWTASKESGFGQVRATETDGSEVATTPRWRGYSIDDDGFPTLRYDLVAGDILIEVREQPRPTGEDRLGRHFEMTTDTPVTLSGLLEDHHVIDGPASIETTSGRCVVSLPLGRTRFTLEVSW